jgi:hypothetical protein
MRTNHLKHPNNKNKAKNNNNNNNNNKQPEKFPASQLTILIRIKQSSTIPRLLLLLKPRCPPHTDLHITPPRENIILQSPKPRRTIGQISPILRREDAFRIELHKENFVRLLPF